MKPSRKRSKPKSRANVAKRADRGQGDQEANRSPPIPALPTTRGNSPFHGKRLL